MSRRFEIEPIGSGTRSIVAVPRACAAVTAGANPVAELVDDAPAGHLHIHF